MTFYIKEQFSSTQASSSKYTYQMRIWKVYMVLLEYACKTDYKLITSQMEKEHQTEVSELVVKYQTEIDKLELSEAKHK